MTNNEIKKAVNKREMLYNRWVEANNAYIERDNADQQKAVIEAWKEYKAAKNEVIALQEKYPHHFAQFSAAF